MLFIDFNVPAEKVLEIPEGWYKAYYDQSWFDNPEVVRIAEEIDGVHHEWADYFNHPYTGRCSGMDLSGGAMTVILAYLGVAKDWVLPLSWLGENCYKTLGSLDIQHDVIFDGDTYPRLKVWNCDFKSVRSGKILNNFYDYFEEHQYYVYKDPKRKSDV